jgi:hypothetical protein
MQPEFGKKKHRKPGHAANRTTHVHGLRRALNGKKVRKNRRG